MTYGRDADRQPEYEVATIHRATSVTNLINVHHFMQDGPTVIDLFVACLTVKSDTCTHQWTPRKTGGRAL